MYSSHVSWVDIRHCCNSCSKCCLGEALLRMVSTVATCYYWLPSVLGLLLLLLLEQAAHLPLPVTRTPEQLQLLQQLPPLLLQLQLYALPPAGQLLQLLLAQLQLPNKLLPLLPQVLHAAIHRASVSSEATSC
jgi:hypothetical protein